MAGLLLVLMGGAPSPVATAATRDIGIDRTDHDVDHPGGEPQIAVNPRDPRNLVVGENVTGVAYTRDGGSTWHHVAVPNIGDNVVSALPDGTFLFSSIDGNVHASLDGGRTWVKVGNWVGAIADTFYAAFPQLPYPANVGGGDVVRQIACDAPSVAGAGPAGVGSDQPGVTLLGCDRPWLATDPQTGRSFLSFSVHTDASGGPSNPLDFPSDESALGCHVSSGSSPFQCGRQYVSASGNGGRTWSSFVPMDSQAYPAAGTNGWSGGPVASFGTLATAYIATGAGCASACIVFETSLDDGRDWQRHLVAPVAMPVPGAGGASTSINFEPYTAADPSRPGRFAVLAFDRTQKHLLVYVTSDNGRSWERTALSEPGAGVARWTPWIDFGPSGALGAMWRTSYGDGSFDVWAAVAPRGDTRFAAPVRLSSSRSPGPVAPGGDDASDVVLTGTTLYATWGDQRGVPAPAAWFGSATNHVGSYRLSAAKVSTSSGHGRSGAGRGSRGALAATGVGNGLASAAVLTLMAALLLRRVRARADRK